MYKNTNKTEILLNKNIATVTQATTNPIEMPMDLPIELNDEGYILTVPLCFYNIRPCSNLIIYVSVYKDGKPYAKRSKQVYTGPATHYTEWVIKLL